MSNSKYKAVITPVDIHVADISTSMSWSGLSPYAAAGLTAAVMCVVNAALVAVLWRWVLRQTLKRKCRHFDEILSLAALRVVILTTSAAISDADFIKTGAC